MFGHAALGEFMTTTGRPDHARSGSVSSEGRSGATRGRLAAAGVALVLASCVGDSPTEPIGEEASALRMEEELLDLLVGASRILRVSATDAAGDLVNAELTWSTSDGTVAQVNSGGFVTAWAHGSATITATSGSAEASAVVQVTGIEDPLVGVVNEDFFYTNYVDQGGGSGIMDYACGPKSYDGHLGVDIVLPDFRKMDEGVDVVAVAAGTVVRTHDGEFDRQKAWSSDPWNVVVIDHDGQLQSTYGHLKSGSVAVTVGNRVSAGTKLGEVGSSGRSDIPHLHLELEQNSLVVDPYGGACSSSREYFREPLAYQDEFRLISAQISDRTLTVDIAKDGPAPVDAIDSDDTRMTAWVQLHNWQANSTLVFALFRPDGSLHGSFDIRRDSFASLSWWWAWWEREALDAWPGLWTVEVSNNGQLLATRTFELIVEVPAPAAMRVDGRSTSGSGGGVAFGDRGAPVGRE